jgi:hypothetical protein
MDFVRQTTYPVRESSRIWHDLTSGGVSSTLDGPTVIDFDIAKKELAAAN